MQHGWPHDTVTLCDAATVMLRDAEVNTLLSCRLVGAGITGNKIYNLNVKTRSLLHPHKHNDPLTALPSQT